MNKIVIGDIVNISWEYVPCEFNVKVLYVPIATGDSWKFERSNGSVFYVITFCKMSKL